MTMSYKIDPPPGFAQSWEEDHDHTEEELDGDTERPQTFGLGDSRTTKPYNAMDEVYDRLEMATCNEEKGMESIWVPVERLFHAGDDDDELDEVLNMWESVGVMVFADCVRFSRHAVRPVPSGGHHAQTSITQPPLTVIGAAFQTACPARAGPAIREPALRLEEDITEST